MASSIVEPLIYVEGEFQAYTEWEPVDVNPVETATAAQFDWKQLAATIAISGLEEAQNNSKEMIVNLLEAKIMQAEDTLKTRINQMLFGTYGGADAAPTASPASRRLVDDTAVCGWHRPGEQRLVGIAVDHWRCSRWCRSRSRSSATPTTSASDAGNDRVDALFTNAYGFGFYESTLTPQVRYTDTAKANLGFQNLMFKNVPMFWDFDCSGAGTDGHRLTTRLGDATTG